MSDKPVTPTTENPYRQFALADPDDGDYPAQIQAWDEGFAAGQSQAWDSAQAEIDAVRAAGRAAATPDPPTSDEFTEAAWGLIANAYGGNWSEAPDEWHGAAARWRDEYVAGAVAAPPAASPDERLREAVRDARDHAYVALQVGVPHDRIIDHLRDIWEACSAALAAADREKPPAGSDGEDRPA